jgi:hypothetical protein
MPLGPQMKSKKNIKPAVIGWLNCYLTKWLNEVEKLIFNLWFTNPWLNL